MPKMIIKPTLNLENIRCFLYGYGTNDGWEKEALYKTPALNRGISGHEPERIKNRRDFLSAHFGSDFVDYMTERYLGRMGKKEKNDFIRELCGRKESRMGTVSFIKNISEMCKTGKGWFSLPDLIEINKAVLSQWEMKGFDDKMRGFLEKMTEVENNDTVSYILQNILHKASIHTAAHGSLESRAEILSLTMLAALLREDFPITLLKADTRKYSDDQKYHMENLFAAVQSNLSVLNMQLFAQENFLKKTEETFSVSIKTGDDAYDLISREHNMNFLRGYYSLQLFEMDKADYMMDYTDMKKEMEKYKFQLAGDSIPFLHNAAFYMREFGKDGMKQMLHYASSVFSHGEEAYESIRFLCKKYRECISWYRKVIYWNLVTACHGQPYNVIKDMAEFAMMLYPEETPSFFLYYEMNLYDIKKEETSIRRQFCLSMKRIKYHHMAVTFPEMFYDLDFVKHTVFPESVTSIKMRYIGGSDSENHEHAVIDVFFDEFKRLDQMCKMQKDILDDLYAMVSMERNSMDEKIKSKIDSHRSSMEKILKVPPVVIKEPLAGYMKEKNIKTAEFQNFCTYIYGCVLEHLRYIDLITENGCDSREKSNDCIRNYHHAEKSCMTEIRYLNEIPNYWFAGWSEEALEYLKIKSSELLILSIDWDVWVDTREEAEFKLFCALDSMENDTLKAERSIAEAEQNIFEMENEWKSLIADLEEIKNNV